MKRLLLILSFLIVTKTLLAEHITGGEMFYTYEGFSGGRHNYTITLKLYRDCNSAGAGLDVSAPLAIFNLDNNTSVFSASIPRSRVEILQLGAPGPCIENAPVVCYEVGYYTATVSLDPSNFGYMAAYQRCCRINGISNLTGSGNTGVTYTAMIPGTRISPTNMENNSARFTGKDTVIVCGGFPFTYSFGAVDADPNDQLVYYFSRAFAGGGPTQGTGPNNATPNPPPPPPYNSVNYRSPFSATAPLGPNVTINPSTGLISGTSPAEGIYVVTVCVDEIRNGVVIATQRKDLQIKAGGCRIAKAVLDPEYITCDGFTYDFSQVTNPLVTSYEWNFGDPASGANNTSTLQNPSHTFSAAGEYTVKLVTNRNGECSDSAVTRVKVYPGFFPDFSNAGICLTNPVQFQDQTTANFGVVDSWQWSFDDPTSPDIPSSDQQHPSWQYSAVGTKNVRLIVGSSVGCVDTIIKPITIIDKPPITLAFKDTLICVPDAVQLQASGTGNFSWTPLTNITGANTATPTVNPTTTTTYQVQLDEQGCINTDTVRVRVVNFVTLTGRSDTTICLTDSVQLNINTDALSFQWTPAATLNNATIEDPVATPTSSTTYQVQANIGSCVAFESIRINTVPYPVANAGPDTTICYNTPAFLQGSHNGVSFAWSPTASLLNANTLTPTAYPARTTEYVLSSTDNAGCPKPGFDTVLVTVLPKIIPYAGNDTIVVVGQPLQLNAEGGVTYNWSPPDFLNDPNIPNPVGVYNAEVDSITYVVRVFNAAGCYDSTDITVVVFKTNPYVFVPTGFTPNGDGLNDIVAPVAVGVKDINYFKIFNRWGQEVFSTTINGKGWDGRISGVMQASNVFVWMVGATDYTGKKITLKGTVTLIR